MATEPAGTAVSGAADPSPAAELVIVLLPDLGSDVTDDTKTRRARSFARWLKSKRSS